MTESGASTIARRAGPPRAERRPRSSEIDKNRDLKRQPCFSHKFRLPASHARCRPNSRDLIRERVNAGLAARTRTGSGNVPSSWPWRNSSMTLVRPTSPPFAGRWAFHGRRSIVHFPIESSKKKRLAEYRSVFSGVAELAASREDLGWDRKAAALRPLASAEPLAVRHAPRRAPSTSPLAMHVRARSPCFLSEQIGHEGAFMVSRCGLF